MSIRPTFKALLSGAATLLVLFPPHQPQLRPVNTKSDVENMRSDVLRIGGDFQSALNKYDESKQKKENNSSSKLEAAHS